MSVFDFEAFIADVQEYRRQHCHTLHDIGSMIGRPYKTVRDSLKPPFDRTWLLTAVLLADYADLSLDKYRKDYHVKESGFRIQGVERGRTKSGYPILRSARTGRAL